MEDHQQSQGQAGHQGGDLSSSAGQTVDPEAYEREHVHGVYEAIAPHFSATRHKPWPLVSDFLRSQARGSIGLDVGCGNGKYLGVADGVYLVGSDRSASLVGLAKGERLGGNDVLVADGLELPFRKGVADFVISVAVIHHLSTRERRQDGIRKLLECVGPGGGSRNKVLVYVWALEQGSSRRGWDEGGEQDLLVPWVMKNNSGRKKTAAETKAEQPQEQSLEQTFQRYYHLYRKGELEEDIQAAGGEVLSSGYERDNWWAIAQNT